MESQLMHTYSSLQPPSEQVQQIIHLKVQLTKYQATLRQYEHKQSLNKINNLQIDRLQKQNDRLVKFIKQYDLKTRQLQKMITHSLDSLSNTTFKPQRNNSNHVIQNDSNLRQNKFEKINTPRSGVPLSTYEPHFITKTQSLRSRDNIDQKSIQSKKSLILQNQDLNIQKIGQKFNFIIDEVFLIIKKVQELKRTISNFENLHKKIEDLNQQLKNSIRGNEQENQQKDQILEKLVNKIGFLQNQLIIKEKNNDELSEQNAYLRSQLLIIGQKKQLVDIELNNEKKCIQIDQKRKQVLKKCENMLSEIHIGEDEYLSRYLNVNAEILDCDTISRKTKHDFIFSD